MDGYWWSFSQKIGLHLKKFSSFSWWHGLCKLYALILIYHPLIDSFSYKNKFKNSSKDPGGILEFETNQNFLCLMRYINLPFILKRKKSSNLALQKFQFIHFLRLTQSVLVSGTADCFFQTYLDSNKVLFQMSKR